MLDVEGERISVEWIEMCGARPTRFAATPVGKLDLHLVIVSIATQAVEAGELEDFARLFDDILTSGHTTDRRRDTSQRIAALIDNLPIPLIFVDSRSIEVFLNDRSRALLGVEHVDASEAVVASALAKLIANAGNGGRARLATDPTADVFFEVEHQTRIFSVESRWIDDDRLTGRLWLFRNVTEERRATHLREELVSTVSHELRTPLTSISGALALLQGIYGTNLPEPAAPLLTIAARNAGRLVKLVDDLLDLDKLQAGRFAFHFVRVNLANFLDEAVQHSLPYADRGSVELMLEMPEQMPAVLADSDRLMQVMLNLISNAVKFSNTGGIVRIRATETPDRVRISVIDEGPGISEDFRARLFDRFAQDSNVPMEGVGSTGLGLAISKAIIDQMNGSIMAAYVPVGATFIVELPRWQITEDHTVSPDIGLDDNNP